MLFMIASNLMLAKFPRKVAIYLVKVNNWNTRTKCEIYSKLAIKTPERHVVSGIFIANFEHISFVPVFSFLTLNKYLIIFITGHVHVTASIFFLLRRSFLWHVEIRSFSSLCFYISISLSIYSKINQSLQKQFSWTHMIRLKIEYTHLPFTCSKSIIETLLKDVKYVQS